MVNSRVVSLKLYHRHLWPFYCLCSHAIYDSYIDQVYDISDMSSKWLTLWTSSMEYELSTNKAFSDVEK